MEIVHAQREVRSAYLGGFIGQLVSAALWAGSGALAVWGTRRAAILFLVLGGVLIYPLTRIGLRLIGRPSKLSAENPLSSLGAQVAFVLPLSLPVVGAATLERLEWFYPTFMVVLGAHYLPFVFLYGMRMFAVLAGVLWTLGILLGTHLVFGFSLGAWLTAVVLLLFAFVGRAVVLREERSPSPGSELPQPATRP